MVRLAFFKVVVASGLLFVFTRIYQHNQIVRLNYAWQRLEHQQQQLSKKINDLLVQRENLKSYHETRQWALHVYGMQASSLSKVVTVTGYAAKRLVC
ncbi:hypothetical protein K2W90_07010 [Candidatus Babeliales bacterium]|nr:hypothetical protein [Candidatus Babeliales bacterium]